MSREKWAGFIVLAGLFVVFVSGCSHKDDEQPQGKVHFEHGPGLTPEQLAQANAFRQGQQQKPAASNPPK